MLLTALVARAGAQWTPQTSPTNAEFRGLSVVSPTVAWASGTHGRVVRTTDGGRTWTLDSIAGAGSFDLRAIAARGDTRAWVITSGPAEQGQAHVFHTIDGRQWTNQFETTQQGVFLDAMAFWDDAHGIALSDPVGGKPFIIVTDDGGKTWTQVPTDGAPAMLPNEASFAASGTCLNIQGTSNVWFATGGGARQQPHQGGDEPDGDPRKDALGEDIAEFGIDQGNRFRFYVRGKIRYSIGVSIGYVVIDTVAVQIDERSAHVGIRFCLANAAAAKGKD